jgi:voltage-gated potassium channel Kch
VGEETKIERWLERTLRRATRPRRAAAIIATVTTSLTVLSGLLMTVIDHRDFPSIGGGLWWSVQTVTTVGYGDRVPEDVAGRIVATVVMLGGLGFLTVITAAITSSFVGRAREERLQEHGELPSTEAMDEIVERLRRIEASMTERSCRFGEGGVPTLGRVGPPSVVRFE